MPITPKQREERRKHLGGSDLPALVLGPAHRLYEVWASKVYPTDDFTNDAMEAGNILEAPVLDWAEKQLGPIRRNCHDVVDGGIIEVNLDGVILDKWIPVEAKTSGIVGPVYGEWGDDGTDQVPDAVMVQCHGHMLATGADICHVPALIGGRGFLMFHVPRCPALCDIITTRAAKFWENHVKPATPPDAAWDALSGPSLDVLKRIQRVPGKLATIDPGTVKRFEIARDFAAMVGKVKGAAQAALLAALGDAEGALLPDGRMVRDMGKKRKGYTVAEGTSRVLRIVRTPQALLGVEGND